MSESFPQASTGIDLGTIYSWLALQGNDHIETILNDQVDRQ